MSNDDGGPLLIEKRIERPQAAPLARRITSDGRFMVFSDRDPKFKDGAWTFEHVPPAWRFSFPVSDDHLARIREAIRAVRFTELQTEYYPDRRVIGGSDVIWSVCLDGVVQMVAVRGAAEAGVPELAALEEVFETVAAEAAGASAGSD